MRARTVLWSSHLGKGLGLFERHLRFGSALHGPAIYVVGRRGVSNSVVRLNERKDSIFLLACEAIKSLHVVGWLLRSRRKSGLQQEGSPGKDKRLCFRFGALDTNAIPSGDIRCQLVHRAVFAIITGEQDRAVAARGVVSKFTFHSCSCSESPPIVLWFSACRLHRSFPYSSLG